MTQPITRHRLPLSSIDVGERIRQDYQDLPGLMESIKKHGLIQPIVVTPPVIHMTDGEFSNADLSKLIAGGRRYYAHVALTELGTPGFDEIDVVYKDAPDEDDLREMELEENLQRADMTWQELFIGVLNIHIIKSRKALALGESWNQHSTSIAIGKSQQRVSQILPIARALKADPNSPLWQCRDSSEAISKMLELREQAAKAALAAKSLGTGKSFQLPTVKVNYVPTTPSSTTALPGSSLASRFLPVTPGQSSLPTGTNPPAEEPKVRINLAEFFNAGHCIPWMIEHKGEFDHIITDPPYAIDMDNLQQENTGMNIESTREAHDVKKNLDLMKDFVQCAAETLKDRSFLVMFCDFMNFRFLHDLGVKNGFSVQRWPVLYCKPQGMNQAAGFNFTKAAECAIVMRKGAATLQRHEPLNWRCIQKSARDKDFDHPFAKPYDLWLWMIEACTAQHSVVLDPFTGSGSGVPPLICSGRQWRACEDAPQHVMEFLRNISKCYQEQFAAQKIGVDVHYTPNEETK